MKIKSTLDTNIKLNDESGIYYYRGTPNSRGRSIFRSLNVKTFREAKIAKRRLIDQLSGIDINRQGSLTFSHYVNFIFLEERKKKKKKTFEQALYCTKHMMPFWGNYKLINISDSSWLRYVDEQKAEHPNRKLYYDRRHLMMILKRVQREGLIKSIPLLPLEKEETLVKRIFTMDEMRRLYDGAKSHENLQSIILLMFKMGMRTSEATKLEWDRVDFDKNVISLRAEDTKTKKPRKMKMNPDVRKSLLEKRKINKKGVWVFPSKTKRGYPIDRINKQWRRLCEECNIPEPNRPYFMRHTFLTECAKKVTNGKLSLVLVVKYAGTSIEVFEREYLHLNAEDTELVSGLIDLKL